MVPGAVVFATGGAVGMGAGQVLQRHMLRKDHRLFTESEVALTKSILDFAGYVFLALPLWYFFGGSVLAPNSFVFWGALLMWIVANIGVTVGGLYAARYAEVSLTLPYQAATPGLLTLAVFLIGERPSTWGYIGIFTIAIGTYIHGRLGCGSIWAYFTPLWRLFFLRADYHLLSESEKQKTRDERKGVRLALLSAFCGTFGLLGEGLMARHGNPAVAGTAGMASLFLFYVVWNRMTARSVGASSLPPFRERIRLHGKWIGWRGLASLAASFLPMIANRLAPIVYVGTLKRIAIPIGVFMAARWFREKVVAGRWITTAIITAGAMILVFDGTPAKIVDFLDQLFGSP